MEPYLSFVMCGCNDGHGGNFLERSQNALNSIFGGAKDLNAEIVFVEWGNPPGAPGMESALDWSRATIPVRIIKVPKAFIDAAPIPHNTYLEYWAKNVGIRRSAGQFVLVTNPDDIYGPEIMSFFTRKELDPTKFYRVNIHNMRNNVVFQIIKAHGNFAPGEVDNKRVSQPGGYAPYADNMLHFVMSGDFILASRDKYFEIHGCPETNYCGSVDGQTVYLLSTHGLTQVVLPYPVYHADHPRGTRPGSTRWSDSNPFAEQNGDGWGFQYEQFDQEYIYPGFTKIGGKIS